MKKIILPLIRCILKSNKGYLYEIPLLVIIMAVVAAVVAPYLGDFGKKALFGFFIITMVIFLVYNFIFSGWLPGKRDKK